MSDRDNIRRLTLLLDALDQERSDFKVEQMEHKARCEVLIAQLMQLRADIKSGQTELFTESAEKGESPAAEESARAAAVGADYPQSKPPLPSADEVAGG